LRHVFLIQQHFGGVLGQLYFDVPHSSSISTTGIKTVRIADVALRLEHWFQAVTDGFVASQLNKPCVNRAVTVRVVVTKNITDNFGSFNIPATKIQVIRSVQQTAVQREQTIIVRSKSSPIKMRSVLQKVALNFFVEAHLLTP
jgi:hypothetical protein